MAARFCMLLMALLFTGCGNSAPASNPWEDIDYSKVHQPTTENDPAYTAPSVVGCVDDDLYNCSGKSAY